MAKDKQVYTRVPESLKMDVERILRELNVGRREPLGVSELIRFVLEQAVRTWPNWSKKP